MDLERSGPSQVYLGCRSNGACWLISYRHGGEGGVKVDSGLHNWVAGDTC